MNPTVQLAVDGFPLDPNDPDIRFHRELSAWLELDNVRRVPVTLQTSAPAPEQRWDWLRASLLRFQWVRNHAALLAAGQAFDRRLAKLIALLINRISLVDSKATHSHQKELAMLAVQGAALDACEAGSMFRSDTGRLLLDIVKQSTPATREAIHIMLRELPPIREPANRTRELAWRLFLEDDDPDDGDPCWSAPVRRELQALKPSKRKPWAGLLKLAPMSQAPDGKWDEKVKRALDRIGREEWESRFTTWMAELRGSELVALERSGQALLQLVIEMTGVVESPALTSSLAALVDVHWDSPRSEAFWVEIAPRLALRLYPHGEMHEAIRKLAARRECAGVPEIQQILEEVRSTGRALDAAGTGIDGFPLGQDSSLAPFQSRIDRLLQQPASAPDDSVRYLLPQASAGNKELLLRAIQQRIEWLTARTPGLDMQFSMEWARVSNWNNVLKSLRSTLLRSGVRTDRPNLLRLLREGNHAAFDHAAEYTTQNGYTAEIVDAVRQYHDTLHGSVSDQARRQQVGWWLWLEDVTPIKAEECWSGIIRADLRGFAGTHKKAWLDLIGNMTFAVSAKAPAKWTKAAETALAAVGPEDFRDQVRHWLAPMEPIEKAKPLRISTPGRDLLRCLIWDSLLCPSDPQLDEALTWIGKATWKNKESRDRMLKIYGPLSEVLSARNPELARQLDGNQGSSQADKPAPKAADLEVVFNKAMSQALKSLPVGERIDIHPDHIVVRGERDHYRIGMDGVITRRSNGRPVRIDMDALPFYITQAMQPAIDAMDLAKGMFQPNRMRLFSLATILAHDAQWQRAIE
jgi:hypothetical protein